MTIPTKSPPFSRGRPRSKESFRQRRSRLPLRHPESHGLRKPFPRLYQNSRLRLRELGKNMRLSDGALLLREGHPLGLPALGAALLEVGDDGFRVPGASAPCSVSAYADDVSVFVTSDSGFGVVERTYYLFARASAARLNTKKNQGLFVGSWIGRSDRPLNARAFTTAPPIIIAIDTIFLINTFWFFY